jgi:hypothetical protein
MFLLPKFLELDSIPVVKTVAGVIEPMKGAMLAHGYGYSALILPNQAPASWSKAGHKWLGAQACFA